MAETDEQRASVPDGAQVVGTPRRDTGAPRPAAFPSGAPPARPARARGRARRNRRWRIASGMVAILAVAATVLLLAWPAPPAQPARPAVVLIVPRADGVECVRDAEWAPTSKRLVVLGYSGACPGVSSGGAARVGLLLVYDALTGSLMSRIHPDALITRAAHLPAGSVVEYSAAMWSPDGKRIAVSFAVAPTALETDGIYLCDADGSHATVLTRTLAPGDTAAGRWDLQTGAYIPSAGLPAALAYQWTAGDDLAATASLTTTSPPSAAPIGAIGLPDGDSAFAVWQPAAITLRAPREAGGQPAPDGAYVLSASFAIWSPDGRYLIPNAGAQARLQPADMPVPSPATLAALGLDAMPLLPVRDRALQVALDRLGARAPDQRGGSPMLVAWSPNGRLLAVQLVPSELNDSPHVTHHALIVYDCATGKALTALVPDSTDTPVEGPTIVRWSPDGTRVMLFDGALGTLTLFGPGKVPVR